MTTCVFKITIIQKLTTCITNLKMFCDVKTTNKSHMMD